MVLASAKLRPSVHGLSADREVEFLAEFVIWCELQTVIVHEDSLARSYPGSKPTWRTSAFDSAPGMRLNALASELIQTIPNANILYVLATLVWSVVPARLFLPR